MNGLQRPPIPPAYDFLYATHTDAGIPVRYKVAKGGRGKGASWSIARRLLDKANSQRRLILCTREVQNSIADSVHRLLREQIRILGYSELFTVTKNSIKGNLSDSEFIFRGLNDLTVDDIKSYEGITDVWCAEAHSMGARSWRILEPTIRTDGSQIYVDYNPDDEEAPTNQLFTVNCPDDAIVRHVNFDQNPYFPAVLEKLRQRYLLRVTTARNQEERAEAQDEYDHVWLGYTRKISQASIFRSRVHYEDFETPANVQLYHGADWGFANDPSVLLRCWIKELPEGNELYIDREVYGYHVEIDELPAMFDKIPSARRWPIKADSSRPETISYMQRKGFNISAAKKWDGSVEDGIAYLKGFKRIIIHKTNCPKISHEARAYRYKVDKKTEEILPIIVDADNHGWDSARYSLDGYIKHEVSILDVL